MAVCESILCPCSKMASDLKSLDLRWPAGWTNCFVVVRTGLVTTGFVVSGGTDAELNYDCAWGGSGFLAEARGGKK